MHSVMEKATGEMKDNKATGDDYVPGDLLKLFGEDALRTVTQLINNIYETREFPRNFSEVTVIALKKQSRQRPSRIQLDHNTAKLVVRIRGLVLIGKLRT